MGEVLKLEYGKPLSKEDRDDYGAYPAYGANGIKCRTNRLYRNRSSIIVGRKGSAGEVTLTEEKFWPLDVTYFVDFDERQYDLMFLHYCLTSLRLQSLAKGVKPGINRNDVYAIERTFPPLPEQKCIVAILDEAFAHIRQTVANAEKNLTNARELFENTLNKVFTQKGEGWVEKSIDNISTVMSGHSFKSSDFSEMNVAKSIKITNVGVRSFVADKSNLLPLKFLEQYKKFKVPDGSIVIALTRSIISDGLKVAVVPPHYDGALLNQRVAAVISRPSIILNQYLFFFLCSAGVVDYVKKKANTLMQPNLSINALKNLSVPIPPLTVQEELLKKLNSIVELTQRLETVYKKKLTVLAELKQSILKKAFSGELTADTVQQQASI